MTKQNPNKYIKPCTTANSNICPKMLAEYNLAADTQKFYVLRCSNILSNVKFYHFFKNEKTPWNVIDKKQYMPNMKLRMSSEGSTNEGRPRRSSMNVDRLDHLSQKQEIDEKNLLIERQPHDCLFAKDYRQKKDDLDKKREQLKSDYRLIHCGLLEVALTKLKLSRPRDLSIQKNYNYDSPVYGNQDKEHDEEDLDELLRRNIAANEGNLEWDMSRRGTIQDMLDAVPNLKKAKGNEFSSPEYNNDGSSGDSAEYEKEKAEKKLKRENSKLKSKLSTESKRSEGEQSGGLFGITQYDSDEDEEHLPVRKAFSFVESNLDKFNILNYIEDQENKVSLN